MKFFAGWEPFFNQHLRDIRHRSTLYRREAFKARRNRRIDAKENRDCFRLARPVFRCHARNVLILSLSVKMPRQKKQLPLLTFVRDTREGLVFDFATPDEK